MEQKNFRKWLEGEISEEEFRDLASEKNLDVENYIKISRESSNLKTKRPNKTEAWNKIVAEIATDGDAKQNNNYKIYKIAATILILFTLSVLGINNASNKIIVVDRGAEILEVTLPDNSRVLLNAESEIKYNTFRWLWSKRISIEGSALIEVEKGRKFSVNSRHGVVEVLGTKFVVHSRDIEYKVSCIEGRVKVSRVNNEVILEKGTATKLNGNNKLVKPFKIDPLDEISWVEGIYVFEDELLLNVLMQVERIYDIKINASKIEARFYTGTIPSDNLEKAIQLICIPMGLSFDIENGMVTIE